MPSACGKRVREQRSLGEFNSLSLVPRLGSTDVACQAGEHIPAKLDASSSCNGTMPETGAERVA